MKIKVVKDRSGKVIATFESSSVNGTTLTPVLPDGHKVEEIEVAENYKDNLSAVYSAKGA
jgi:hypothetical protein